MLKNLMLSALAVATLAAGSMTMSATADASPMHHWKRHHHHIVVMKRKAHHMRKFCMMHPRMCY